METIENVISRVKDTLYPVAYDQLRDLVTTALFNQLKTVNAEDELEKAILEDKLVEKYKDAVIPTYEPVGVLASTIINENQTQSALSSHRDAGIKRGAVGFQRIEEISNMNSKSGIVKVITTTIGGIPRPKREVVDIADQIESVDVNDIIDYSKSKYSIEKVEGDGNIFDLLPGWYLLFSLINNISGERLSKTWIRVYLDKKKMFKHKISISTVAASVQESLDGYATVIYPPSTIGSFIDVHIRNYKNDNMLYSLLGDINSSIVGGIPSVQRAYAISEDMIMNLDIKQIGDNLFELTSRAPKFIPDTAWANMIKSFIPDAIIIGGKKFQSQYTLLEIRKMILECPLIYADVIKSRVKDDETGIVHIEFDTEKVNEFPYLEYANLEPQDFPSDEEADKYILQIMVENHLYWYIEANCSKVETLYALPEIDTTRTYTTSPLDCRDSLGYLAMRQMLYQDFMANIQSVDPIHIKLVIDNMTVYREPVSFKRQAIRNDKSEPLTYCTFEEVLKYLAAAAFAGEEDHMTSISSHILTGSMIDIGRGGKHLKKTSPNNLTGNKFIEIKNELAEESDRSKQRDTKNIKSDKAKSTSKPKARSTTKSTTTNDSKSATRSTPSTTDKPRKATRSTVKTTRKPTKTSKPETTVE